MSFQINANKYNKNAESILVNLVCSFKDLCLKIERMGG